MTTLRYSSQRLAYGVVALAIGASMLACSLIPGSGATVGTPTPIPGATTSSSAAGSSRELRSGEAATGRLAANSAEVFSVKVEEGQALRLELDVEGKADDLTVGVADGTGKVIATQSSVTGKRLTVVTGPLAAGDYTVTVTNTGASEAGYTVTATTGDAETVGVLPVSEEEAAATAVAAGSDPTPTTGEISGPAGGDVGQTACDHPYFPMRPGATWIYDFVSAEYSGQYTMVIDSVTGDRESAQATMTANFAELVITYSWTCTRAGGVQSFDYAMGAATGGGLAASNMTGEGYFLVPADQLVTNASWTYSSAGEMTMEVSGQSLSGSTTSNTTQTVAGVGGSYDYQGATLTDVVVILSEQITSVSMAGIETPGVETTSTLEFARGIGLISSASGGEYPSSMTLVSHNIP